MKKVLRSDSFLFTCLLYKTTEVALYLCVGLPPPFFFLSLSLFSAYYVSVPNTYLSIFHYLSRSIFILHYFSTPNIERDMIDLSLSLTLSLSLSLSLARTFSKRFQDSGPIQQSNDSCNHTFQSV